MTKISLRVYNREIEAMVEGGNIGEAIAHCQHILKTFPMYLETYRLLGKAFLEARRYTDAADIFQRILMSVPDDFISHVGMSIIRDDESKLDEAIWHMERAFEVQPSNPAIQDELRKLYGRRDGVKPPKVRLTRDALANMYTQGALYSQAIAEIRAVLVDDPNRPDLQVMLARAYSKDGRKKQAIEICTDLLKKYPYCFDALRILLDLMPSTDQHEITQTYRHRIKAIDPYAGFVTGSIFNSDKVADTAVNLEFLDYDPNNMESEAQPPWASSLGIKLGPDNTQQGVPDWLSEKTTEELPISEEDSSTPVKDEEEQASSEIVEVSPLMRSSGWEKSTDLTFEPPVFEETESESDEPIARADLPEWLKDMAPKRETPEAGQASDTFGAMLDEAPTSSVQGVIHLDADEESGITKADFSEDIPGWLKDMGDDKPVQAEAPMVSPAMDAGQEVIGESALEQTQETSQKPDEESGITNAGFSEEVPDWLKDLVDVKPIQAEAPMASLAMDAAKEVNGELALEQTQETSQKPDEESDIANVGPEEENPDWLKEIRSDEPTNTEMPMASQSLDVGISEFKTEQTQETSEKPFEQTVDFISELLGENQQESTDGGNDVKERADDEEDLPDWLKEVDSTMEEQAAIDETTAIGAVEPAVPYGDEDQTDIPEAISEPGGFVEVLLPSIGEETTMDSKPFEAKIHPMDDQDAALAWLESLAVRQGAKSEELLTKPEDRLDEPPEWVRNTVEELSKPAEDKALISYQDETKFVETTNQEGNSAKIEEDFSDAKFSGDDKLQVLDAVSREELVEDEVFVSTGLEKISEEFVQPEEELPSEIPPSISDVHTIGLGDEFSPEDGLEADQTLHLDHTDRSEPEFAATADADVSKWLQEMDVHDATIEEKPDFPNVEEFYGKDVSEPLPDWLQDLEKESSTDWISKSDDLSEMEKDAAKSELVSDHTDIDDLGEIFPTDPTDWAIEQKETEPEIEPLGDSVKPVAPDERQPMRAEEPAPKSDLTEISKIDLVSTSTEPPSVGELPGTGIISEIPAKDIVKEAETLERAQNFIESGDLKNAIDEYDRLIKKGQLLEGVIHNLRETTSRYPSDIGIWQLLGDAYMRANRLQDALDAYTKAEELLR